METLLTNLDDIISALAVIVCAFFTYNQYAKNKKIDLKIDQYKQEQEVKNKRRADASSIVWGALHNLLVHTKADRVYIVQPHPLGNEEMLTIHYEVTRNGVRAMRSEIQKLKICSVAQFGKYMSENLFAYITNIDKQVSDRYARSIMSTHGTNQLIVKRLSDKENDWVGSIFCEYTTKIKIGEADAKEMLHRAATDIQYILPPIEL